MTKAINPYRTLRLKKDASPDDIEAAYRRAARRTHPDRGGTEEKFRVVQLAYEVLRDPKRRAAFDATGDIGSDRPDQSLVGIMELLSQSLAAVVKALIDNGLSPKSEDVKKHMETAIQQSLPKMREGRATLLKQEGILRECVDKFKVTAATAGAQAAAVKILWAAFDNGTPDVSDATLIEAADSLTNLLREVFKEKGSMHQAWNVMIVPGGTKGTHRLKEA